MNWNRAFSIAMKEVAHVMRDPFTLTLSLGVPVFMVLVFGIAMEFNVKEIPTAVLDSDKTASSRALIDVFASSDYFHTKSVASPVAGLSEVQGEQAKTFVVIPPRFEKELKAGRGSSIQVLIDGADNSTVGSVAGYVGDIQSRAIARITGRKPVQPIDLRTRFLFNPELNSRWFVIPGLTVAVMSILAILLTALTIAREWESGSMELLLSTPVKPIEIIIGKLAPYAGLCLGAVGLVYVLARVVFGVPFVGSHFVFLVGCAIFLVTYLAQGLLISVIVRQQQIAMQLAMLSGLLPSMLLSGFIFPIESMPTFFQYFTMILPARWFMGIARGVFLQGSGFWALRYSFLALTIWAVLMITLATRRFKKDVEP